MGKYTKYRTFDHESKRPWDIHPIWRGIGCLIGIILPVTAYAGAVLLVDANKVNQWVKIPRDLRGPIQIPYLYSHILVALLLTMVGFVAITLMYMIVYRIFGPPQYSRVDAPPPKKNLTKRR